MRLGTKMSSTSKFALQLFPWVFVAAIAVVISLAACKAQQTQSGARPATSSARSRVPKPDYTLPAQVRKFDRNPRPPMPTAP